jgi:hypothetical protein
MEESNLNLFDSVINSGLTLIVDEGDEFPLASFVVLSRSIKIPLKFATLVWVLFAPINVINFSIRLFITFASSFLAFSMFDEKLMPFLPLSFNYRHFRNKKLKKQFSGFKLCKN